MAPTRGTVTIEGQPAVTGRVVFRPNNGGETAIGQIMQDGSFELNVKQKQNGARVGQNHVLVIEARTADMAGDVSYRAPKDVGVVVQADHANEFALDIRAAHGWTVIGD